MSRIGYARVSSQNQKLDRQIEFLKDVSKLFSDKMSGQSIERSELKAMLNYIREAATLEGLNLSSMSGIDTTINII